MTDRQTENRNLERIRAYWARKAPGQAANLKLRVIFDNKALDGTGWGAGASGVRSNMKNGRPPAAPPLPRIREAPAAGPAQVRSRPKRAVTLSQPHF